MLLLTSPSLASLVHDAHSDTEFVLVPKVPYLSFIAPQILPHLPSPVPARPSGIVPQTCFSAMCLESSLDIALSSHTKSSKRTGTVPADS